MLDAGMRRAVVVGALALLPFAPPPLAAAPAAAPELRCSVMVFHTWRGERDVALVGEALADTMRAGAGSVRFEVGPGEDRDAVGRAVHGRLVAVEALDGRTRAMLPAGVARVLLVPWSYDSMCTTAPNDGRVAWWAPPGTRGLFLGRLRDRAHWAGDVPTIDVHAPHDLPYTGRPRSARDTVTALTPAELLGLYDAVRGAADLAGACTAARAWVRAHPDLAARRPAPALLGMMRDPGEAPRYRETASPLLGTWRLEASIDGAAPRIGWVRTWDRTTDARTEPPTPAALAVDPLAPMRVVGYMVVASGDTALATLPTSARPFLVRGSGYLAVAVADERAPLDVGPWQGAFEVDVLAHAFTGDPAIAAFLRDAGSEASARYGTGAPADPPATFTRDSDGTLRVEQRTTLADGRALVIRGVRVSDAAIRDAAPGR